jgi:hypothetical protein
VRDSVVERQMTNDPDPLDALRHSAAWAVTRGSLMFHLDLAALLAREHLNGNPLIEHADGWAVDVTARGYEVVFMTDMPDRELAIVTFAADGSPLVEVSEGAPSPRVRALARAARTMTSLAGRAPHTVIAIPPTAGSVGSELDGYVLRRADVGDDIAIGPHKRFRLSADGRDIVSTELLARSELILPSRNEGDLQGITVTHLLGDVPSEVHVYLGLRHGVPIDVITTSNDEHWRVDGESISLL